MGHADEARLVRGRLSFGDGSAPAPFPSAVIVYRPGQNRLRFSAWTPPKRRRVRDSDDAKSMKSSRRSSLATCPVNGDSRKAGVA
jgi:hypothetical protein